MSIRIIEKRLTSSGGSDLILLSGWSGPEPGPDPGPALTGPPTAPGAAFPSSSSILGLTSVGSLESSLLRR